MNIKSFLAALVLLGAATSGDAQTWSGLGGDNNFSTGGNWVGGVAPAANGNLIFTGTTRLSPNVSANYTAGNITFNSAAGAFTITSPNNRTLTLGNNTTVLNSSANLQTFNAKLNVAGTTTFDASTAGFNFESTTYGQNVFGLAGNAIITGDFNTSIAATKQISGVGQITKNGNGILTISSANLYSGGTTVNGGIVRANNATGSATGTGAVNVNGGVFEGFGTASGSIVVNSGGTISGGSGGVGTLSIGSGTFNGGGTLRFDFAQATGLEGINWDLLNIAGGLTIASSLGNQFNIDINGAATGFDGSLAGQQWRIASAVGGITGFDPSAFNIMTGNFSGDTQGGTFFLTLANGNQDLFLNFAPVPEPSTIALGALGGIALIAGAIRRRK